VNNLKIF